MAEPVETEIVEEDQQLEVQSPTNINEGIKTLLALAENLPKIAEAKDKIRKFCLNRAWSGDWTQFGDKCELGGPGAERVASDLGVNFRNWKSWKEEGSDENGKWITWWYQADASCGSRLIEKVQNRCSSRDKFFGYKHGKWLLLADVKEQDIRMAARRGVYKEGTKLMFGLRSLPIEEAEALGLDPKKIKRVNFDNDKDAAKDEGQKFQFKAKLVSMGTRQTKGGKTVYIAHMDDKKFPKVDTFSESFAKDLKAMVGSMIEMKVKKTRWGANLEEFEPVTGSSK